MAKLQRGKVAEGQGSVKLARALFFLNSAIWLLLAAVSLLTMAGGNADSRFTLAILAVLMFGNAGVLLFCGMTVGKRRRWFYLLAIVVLVINIILSITDEFGLFDFLVLALNTLLLGLLILGRKSYLPPILEPG